MCVKGGSPHCVCVQHTRKTHSSEFEVDDALADAVVSVNVVQAKFTSPLTIPSSQSPPPAASQPGTLAVALVLHANGTVAAWRLHHVGGCAWVGCLIV